MESRRDQPPEKATGLTGFDVAGYACSAFALLVAFVAVLKVQPTFSKLYQDFGDVLPAFSQLCLQPWFPLVVAAVPVLLVTAGLVTRAPRDLRAVLASGAIIISIALPVALAIGIVMPFRMMSTAIK